MPSILRKTIQIIGLLAALALLTQVGGLVLLAATLTNRWLARRVEGTWQQRSAKPGYFTMLYLLTTLLFVPLIARPFGRAPLPLWGDHHVHVQLR